MIDFDIQAFIDQHGLPVSYKDVAQEWFASIIETLLMHQKRTVAPLVVGINGAQGSGKSTLAGYLQFVLEKKYYRKVIAVSIDDFYYTRQERADLARNVHPLLMTRGVPGTHDVELAINMLLELKNKRFPVAIPRFNKASDDRDSTDRFDIVSEAVDIIILEGWCLGAETEDEQDLIEAVNPLEVEEDSNCIWRKYVNDQLGGNYQTLFEFINIWIMLKAPSFDVVYQWRLEQENKLKAKVGLQQQVMNEQQVARFIQFYQRVTQNTLLTLPNKANFLYHLDENRQIIQLKKSGIS